MKHTLDFILAGSEVKRYHTVTTLVSETVGHHSHGVGMLPRYAKAYLEGGLKPNTSLKVLHDAGALLRLDGQAGFGQVGAALAVTGIAAGHGGHIGVLAREFHELGHVGHDVFARKQKVQLGQTFGIAFELVNQKRFHLDRSFPSEGENSGAMGVEVNKFPFREGAARGQGHCRRASGKR